MSEGDVQRSFENELIFIPEDSEDINIDDFEKLYVITAAMMNNPEVFDDEAYNPEDFDEICNFAEFKLKNPHLFKDTRKQPNQKDLSFYTIPVSIKMNGNEEKCYITLDANMNSLHVILPNGNVIPTETFKDLTDIQILIDAGALTDEEASKLLSAEGSIDDIAQMIENDELDIIMIREKALAKVREKGLDPEAIIKEAREKDLAQEEKEEEEKTEDEKALDDDAEQDMTEEDLDKDAIEDAERSGFQIDILQAIASQKGCKLHQIRLRELYREDIIKERTGKDLREYKGRLAMARITYGFKEEMIIVDKTTGRILSDDRRHDHELEDLVPKWPRGTRMPIRKDEGRSYISYLDQYGNVKQTKFLNNGKKIDMSKEERERFIAEVEAVTNELSEAIKAYEKNNTRENWTKVKDAMVKRVALDRKYDALRNQRELTSDTLITTIARTIGDIGAPKKVRELEERDAMAIAHALEKGEEEEDPRLGMSRDPRRW